MVKNVYRRILLNWLPLVSYCIFIFIMSSISTPDLMPTVDYSDKILHFGAFVVLAVLFWRAYSSLHLDLKNRILIVLTLVSSIAFGVLIEVNQSFLSHRHAEMADISADILGALMGIFFSLWYFNKKAAVASEISD